MRALQPAPAPASDRARQPRRDHTPAGRALWNAAREGRLPGIKLRRQIPIGPWIVDVAIVAGRLAIEVDGDTHGTPEARERDERRSRWRATQGWRVLRVTNRDVLSNLDGVLQSIGAALPRAEGQGEGPSRP